MGYDVFKLSAVNLYFLFVPTIRAVRHDIEDEDDQVRCKVASNSIPLWKLSYFCKESYFNAVQSAPIVIYDEGDELDYDSDGNPIIPEGAKASTSCIELFCIHVI